MTQDNTSLPALTGTLAAAAQFGHLQPATVLEALGQVIPLGPENLSFWREFGSLLSDQICQQLIANIRALMAGQSAWRFNVEQELAYDDEGYALQAPDQLLLNGEALPIDTDGDVFTDAETLDAWFQSYPGFDLERLRQLNDLLLDLFWEVRTSFVLTESDFRRNY